MAGFGGRNKIRLPDWGVVREDLFGQGEQATGDQDLKGNDFGLGRLIFGT